VSELLLMKVSDTDRDVKVKTFWLDQKKIFIRSELTWLLKID